MTEILVVDRLKENNEMHALVEVNPIEHILPIHKYFLTWPCIRSLVTHYFVTMCNLHIYNVLHRLHVFTANAEYFILDHIRT